MPEGDTIHRAARTLQQALGGGLVTRFDTVLPALARIDEDAPIAGRTVEQVAAVGKHLLIRFSGPLHLRTHMRMNGSWHLYRPGERWQKPRSDMRIVIETDSWVAVAFNVSVAEFLDARALERSRELRTLGPDLLGEEFDESRVAERIRSDPRREIADVLLDQRVASGIGNVYKSEVLFLNGVNPFARVAAVREAELDAIVASARRLLQHNVEKEAGGRETRHGSKSGDRLWVYGRRGKPCRRCGTIIEMRKQGRDARVTFWCPLCQPPR